MALKSRRTQAMFGKSALKNVGRSIKGAFGTRREGSKQIARGLTATKSNSNPLKSIGQL